MDGSVCLEPADPESCEISVMVHVQMADEFLVEEVIVDVVAGYPAHGLGADVKDELVAVSQFHQPAGRGLFGTHRGLACAAGCDTHLLSAERFGSRKIEAMIGEWFRW